MKKRLVILFAVLLLALPLAACGDRDDKKNDNSSHAGNDVMDDILDDGMLDDSTAGSNAKSRDSKSNTTSFQRMLENARVHDTDGDLTDGENSTW